MLKRVILCLLSLALLWGCSLDSGPGEKGLVPGSVKFSFSGSLSRSAKSDGDDKIRTVLVTVEDSAGLRILTKKAFKVYPMGAMYVSESLSLSGEGDYRLTEFYVLNGGEDVVFAAPLAGSEKEPYVHYPLPLDFSVDGSGDTTVPLEVTPVLGGDQPGDFGYDGLGIRFAGSSVFEGLVLEYMFNGNLEDSAGAGAGSTNQPESFGPDRFGNEGRAFMNSGNKWGYIALPGEGLDSSEISLSFWYNYADNGYTTLVGSGEWGYQHLIINPNTNALGISNTVASYFDAVLEPGQWTHIVLVKKGTTSRLYLNGEDAGRLTTDFDNALHPVEVFGNLSLSADRGALGSLDDLRIYNRVLSGLEVQELYADQAPSVTILRPLAGALVNGLVPIEAEVEEDNALSMVEFYVDGELLSVDLDAPFSAAWDSSGSFNGSHDIEVRAYDSLKNSSSDYVTVNLNNAISLETISIAAGLYHSVALRDDGRVYSWGYSGHGEIGDGFTTARQSPTEVKNLSGITAVSAGVYHTIALRNDGTVWAWGYNNEGEMGDGSTINKTVPGQVKNLTGVTAISAGCHHNLALLADGTVASWGYNNYGQLGHHQGLNQLYADKVEGLGGIIAVAAGYQASYALKSDGTVWAWGVNNYGQAGTGSNSPDRYHTPQQVPGLEGIISLTADLYHVHALKNDGTVWSWGLGTSGELGEASNVNRYAPVKVVGLENIRAIEAGRNHVLAIRDDGTVWAWGLNSSGQIGDASTVVKYAPARVKGLENIVYVSAGYQHSLAVDADGKIYTWGQNTNGQLGNGSSAGYYTVPGDVNWPLPAMVPGDISFESYPGITNSMVSRKVAAGYWFTSCIREDGTVWSWGYNGNGELGINNTARQLSPLQTVDDENGEMGNIVNLVSGNSHSLALDSSGTLWTWGYNGNGQLGINNTANSLRPVHPEGMTGLTDIAGGGVFSLALKADGTVWSWGYNGNGELGDGTTIRRLIPGCVDELENIVRLAAGINHALALKDDGTVWSWGYNVYGQLGHGNTLAKASPVKIEALEGIVDITCGGSSSYALTSDGHVWSWGYNGNGELGDATTTSQSLPVLVSGLENIVKISASANHALAVDSSGGLWVWGYNASSNLGDGTNIPKYTPVRLDGVSGVTDVSGSSGYHHTIALQEDGTIWTWGRYENGSAWYGALGSGLNQNSNIPYNVEFPN